MKRVQNSLDADPALRALRDAVGKVIEDHRNRGKPLAVWHEGKAVWVSPDQLSALRENSPEYKTKSTR
jgi:hypothetical protein